MKFKSNLFKKYDIISICIAGIFIAMILLLNFVFDLFKVWAWSIQMFLVVYAIGIYKIKNIVVNLFFLLIVPPLLFAMENGAYVFTAMQTFFEYFLSFYIFALLYYASFISSLFKSKKNYLLIDSTIFIFSFILLLILKFFMHSIASYIWYGKYVNYKFWPALVYNGPWLATNCLTIPVAISVVVPVFKLFEKVELDKKNKW